MASLLTVAALAPTLSAQSFTVTPAAPIFETFPHGHFATLIVRSPPNSLDRTFSYTVLGNTAAEDQDFNPTTGFLRVDSNTREATFQVWIRSDANVEPDEQFEIRIEPFFPRDTVPSVTPITIHDLRPYGFVPVNPAETTVWENAPSIRVAVHRASGLEIASTITLRAAASDAPNAARAGIDFVDQPHLISFAPGQTLAYADISLLNDALKDGDRILHLQLENPSDAQPITPGLQSWTIKDNELGYSLRNLAGRLEADLYEGSNPYVILHRHGDYDFPSSVQVTFYSETLTEGADYIRSPITVDFAADQKSARINLPILDDSIVEWAERLSVYFPERPGEARFKGESLPIEDNEFNPLPITEWAFPKNVTVRQNVYHIAPAPNGKYFIGNWTPTGNPIVLRLNADRSIDPTFEPLSLPENIMHFRSGPKETLYVLTGGPSGTPSRIWRITGDAYDRSFNTEPTLEITNFTPSPDDRVYIVRKTLNDQWTVSRLRADGSLDPAFNPNIGVSVYGVGILSNGSILATDFRDAAVLLREDGTTAHVLPNRTAGKYTVSQGELFLLQTDFATGSEVVTRLTPSGEPDPAFTQISLGAWSIESLRGEPQPLRDSAGRIYRFTPRFDFTRVERFLANGLPDPSYQPASIDALPYSVVWLRDNELFAEIGWNNYVDELERVVNATPLNSEARVTSSQIPLGGFNFVRINLDPPSNRIALLPGGSQIHEERGAQSIFIIRTDRSHETERSFSYRVRSGTAKAGLHFTAATEGQLHFAVGSSKQPIPITAIDNSILEPNLQLYIDIFDADSLIATLPVQILSDETGLHISHTDSPDELSIEFVSNRHPGATIKSATLALAWRPYSPGIWPSLSELDVAANRPFRIPTPAEPTFFSYQPLERRLGN